MAAIVIKFNIVPVNLAKLSNVVQSDVVKKITYHNLVVKVNTIDLSKISKTHLEKLYFLEKLILKKSLFFKNSFLPSTITEWNNLHPCFRKSESFLTFKTNILKFIRPSSTPFTILITLEEFVPLQDLDLTYVI